MCTDVLTQIAVPTFFFISGYFFFFRMKEWNKTLYIDKLKKRFYTLFIPYILWNLIPIAIRFLVRLANGDDVMFLLQHYTSEGWLNQFWNATPEFNAPINVPMWFVRNLMFLCLASPFIYYYVKKAKAYGIILLGALYVMRIESPFIGIGVADLFFFSAGAFFSLNKISFVEVFKKVRIPAAVLAITTLLIVVWFNAKRTEIGAAIFPLYVIFGSCTAINVSSLLVEKYHMIPNRFLANSSFFIYASHMVYILYTWDVILSRCFPPTTLLHRYIIYVGMPVMCTLSCLLIYYLLQKFAPKTLSLLTGNR